MNHYQFLKKIFVIAVIISLALCGVYYIGYENIKQKNENISKFQQLLSSQVEKQQYMLSTKKIVDSSNADISRINNLIIPSDGDITFIEDLESIAKSNGLTISIDSLYFDNNPVVGNDGMTLFHVKAKTSGGWAGTYTFFSELENLQYKIRIEKLAIISTQDDTAVSTQKQMVKMWQSSFEIIILKYK